MKFGMSLVCISLLLQSCQATPRAEPTDTPEPSLHQKLASVSTESLLTHLLAIEGGRSPKTNMENLSRAQAYIETTFSSLGYDVTHHSFKYIPDADAENVIATRLGTQHPDERIVVLAHFDSGEKSPGADDNGSGMAVMLELAALLRSYSFELTIQFIAINMHELDMIGTRALARYAETNGWQVNAVINLESVGYAGNSLEQYIPLRWEDILPETGDFILVVANEASEVLVEQFIAGIEREQIPLPYASAIVPSDGWALPDSRRGDHSPFWDAHYPAIMLTDTAEYRNPNYHQTSDTIDTLNLDFAALVCQAVGELVNTLAVSIDS
jgi:Zn-dependent M28 family amino/carboxypeptidase